MRLLSLPKPRISGFTFLGGWATATALYDGQGGGTVSRGHLWLLPQQYYYSPYSYYHFVAVAVAARHWQLALTLPEYHYYHV